MLKAINLTKTYNGKPALHNVSFEVKAGEVFCLLGANGAGKTTTINLFLNFIDPTTGQALIDGKDVKAEPIETKKLLAYIPENLTLYPNLTGLENLEYFSALAGKQYRIEQYVQLLLEAGLQPEAHKRKVGTYSKGMRQKVGVAIAVAKDAKALLLDEPTSGLDPKASNDFADLLSKLSHKGVAILMATHDLFRAKESGSHIGIMKEGRLVEHIPAELINHTDLEKLYLRHMS
jgi:ABC-2 type transport system ATP-binding protein